MGVLDEDGRSTAAAAEEEEAREVEEASCCWKARFLDVFLLEKDAEVERFLLLLWVVVVEGVL